MQQECTPLDSCYNCFRLLHALVEMTKGVKNVRKELLLCEVCFIVK